MRLIDADSLKYRREEYGGYDDVPMEERKNGILYLLKEDIDDAPTIDPVKHGKWVPFEFGDETWHKCTACGAADQYGTKHISHIAGKLHIVYAIRNYCPKCGAKMDGEE